MISLFSHLCGSSLWIFCKSSLLLPSFSLKDLGEVWWNMCNTLMALEFQAAVFSSSTVDEATSPLSLWCTFDRCRTFNSWTALWYNYGLKKWQSNSWFLISMGWNAKILEAVMKMLFIDSRIVTPWHITISAFWSNNTYASTAKTS